jgi:hypothetical protein
MPAFPSVYDLACPFCSASAGHACVTSSGRARRNDPHRERWDRRDRLLRSGFEFVVRIKADDEHIGVRAGEEYVAAPYWLDNGKVTLLRRLSDGHDPECNEYVEKVEYVRWAQPGEAVQRGRS